MGEEIEVKFHIPDPAPIEARLLKLGGRNLRPRGLETSLRFDTEGGLLELDHRVLRLRRSDDIRLTYKSAAKIREGVPVREEIEFTVGNFETAKEFLEALGYQVTVIYENYRSAYELEKATILLDELPFGNFIEIEAGSPEDVHKIADLLSLDWEKRIPFSYLALFGRLQVGMGFTFRDLTFDNFSGIHIPGYAFDQMVSSGKTGRSLGEFPGSPG